MYWRMKATLKQAGKLFIELKILDFLYLGFKKKKKHNTQTNPQNSSFQKIKRPHKIKLHRKPSLKTSHLAGMLLKKYQELDPLSNFSTRRKEESKVSLISSSKNLRMGPQKLPETAIEL